MSRWKRVIISHHNFKVRQARSIAGRKLLKLYFEQHEALRSMNT